MIRWGTGRSVLGAVGVAVFVTAGCGTAGDEAGTESSTTTPASPTVSPVETTLPDASTVSPTSLPQEPQTRSPAASVVAEGAECGPRGAVAVFADGSTAYCARLQYTDGAAWSRDPSLAPNPAVSTMLQQSGPQIGDRCIGADIGRTGTDANGTAIICDNYQWVPNVGQVPRHPWVEEQLRWTECLETRTEAECRVATN